MYLELFDLEEHPFRLSPDPSFLYLSPQHARALAYIKSTLWFTDGFVVITGDTGCGKTTLIEKFLSELDETVTVARLAQTQITPVDFLQTLLVEFGYRPFDMGKAELLETINRHLADLLQDGRKVVIVVDEAQNLEWAVLEEIRMLSGVIVGRETVLSIILAGQPGLNETLDSPDLEQLAQRTRLRYHLRPLAHEEIGAYIQHRLHVAGSGERRVFDEATYPMIYRYTGGVPRLINTLCDMALLCAFSDGLEAIGERELAKAVEELQWTGSDGRTDGLPIPRRHPGLRTATDPVARLIVAHGGGEPREVPLVPGRIILGRTGDNDLQIDSKFVSRHHAQIVTYGEESTIEDLNSTNGIYVRGKRVTKHQLRHGDVFVIGEHELMYLKDAPEEGKRKQC